MLHRIAIVAAIASSLAVTALADDKKISVLIVDGQNNHAWKQTTPHMKKWLEASGKFTVDVATSPARPQAPAKPKDPNDTQAKAKFEEDALAFAKAQLAYRKDMFNFLPAFDNYQVVVSNYNGDNWSDAAKAMLDNYVSSGKGGLVIVHAANNSFSGWKEYDLMIGMG